MSSSASDLSIGYPVSLFAQASAPEARFQEMITLLPVYDQKSKKEGAPRDSLGSAKRAPKVKQPLLKVKQLLPKV